MPSPPKRLVSTCASAIVLFAFALGQVALGQSEPPPTSQKVEAEEPPSDDSEDLQSQEQDTGEEEDLFDLPLEELM